MKAGAARPRSSRRRQAASAAIAAAVLFVFGLTACYLPLRFDAEIELFRTGHYEVKFDGYMTWVPFYQKLKDGKLSAKQEKKEAKRIETDLTRDSSTKEFQYFKEGVFRVKWEKAGDLLRSPMIAFVRRNAMIFHIKYVKTKGLVTMRGTLLKKVDADRLDAMGLGRMQGEMRLITDGKVVEHNATSVKKKKDDPRKRVFTWKITSVYDRGPKLVMELR